jgi:hypothetical protein
MQQELENYLKNALRKLETAYTEILKTQGYNKDLEKLSLLCELTKEQIKEPRTDESTHSAASQTR